MDAFEHILRAGEIATWRQVPVLTAHRYKQSLAVQEELLPVMDAISEAPLYLHPETGKIWLHLHDKRAVQDRSMLAEAITATGYDLAEADVNPPGNYEWLPIKRSDEALFNKPFTFAGHLTGGPSPLTNSITGALLGGGLGYGAGWLASQFLPRRYFNRSRIRTLGGVLGAGLGSLPGLKDWYYNSQILADNGQPNWIKALVAPDSQIPYDAVGNQAQTNRELGASSNIMNKVSEWSKQAAEDFMTGQGDLRPVPVDAFNNAIWNDVGKGLDSSRYNPWGTKEVWGDNTQDLHTPPMVGAAVSGIVSGIQQQAGGADILTPRHFISGLMGAGVDGITARITGGVLGALGGLTPPAQEKLQNLGIWGGFMRGVAGSLLGNK